MSNGRFWVVVEWVVVEWAVALSDTWLQARDTIGL